MSKQFWSDVWTVMRKEWMESVATPGCMIQPLVVVIIFGVFTPLLAGRLWLDYPIVQWLWSWLPLAMSAGMVADTFAGERERDTLEALLASLTAGPRHRAGQGGGSGGIRLECDAHLLARRLDYRAAGI